jgi:hypothetical protein
MRLVLLFVGFFASAAVVAEPVDCEFLGDMVSALP